jgi:hypothetical protein
MGDTTLCQQGGARHADAERTRTRRHHSLKRGGRAPAAKRGGRAPAAPGVPLAFNADAHGAVDAQDV